MWPWQRFGQLYWQHLVLILAAMRKGQQVFDALDDEWTRLPWIHDRSIATAWAAAEAVLTTHVTPVDIVQAAQRRGEVEQTNAIVGALLRLADDDRASRALLQAVLPGLRARIRHVGARSAVRRPLPGWDSLDDLGTDMVAMAVERIARLAGSSPPWPAAAIVGGTWRRVRTAAEVALRHEQLAFPLDEAAEVPVAGSGRSTAQELAEELASAVQRQALRPGDARLIYLTRVLGYSPAELAVAGGPDARALRTRRSRAERALLAASA